MSTVHWILKTNSIRTFCGRMRYLVTTRKDRVTCGSCLRLMRLHEHLE
jgi:hypothetical protein